MFTFLVSSSTISLLPLTHPDCSYSQFGCGSGQPAPSMVVIVRYVVPIKLNLFFSIKFNLNPN